MSDKPLWELSDDEKRQRARQTLEKMGKPTDEETLDKYVQFLNSVLDNPKMRTYFFGGDETGQD